MVTSITPIVKQHTPRAQVRVGDRSAYVTLEPDAYLDSTTSATQLATPTNQLSAIDYANIPDQSFTYDLNGNRTGSGNVTGADNRLTSNATWDFVYDANGNMTRRTLKSDNSYIEYTYDHRDRLTDVRYRTSAGTLTKRVHFGYDALNRRYLQTVENGSGTILSTVYYVNQGFRKDRGDAGDEIALRLDGTGAVISRYLHGSLVDEVLAEENIGSGGVRDVLWAMTDHQGSVRDLARVTSGTASVVNHIVYDAFGKTVSETDTAIAHLYGYTGRELDKETGLQYNRARYLDLVLARWISQDPKSFDAGDTNLYRYVGNHPSYATDPSGLFKVGDGHHIIPQELWKSFDTTITDVWDTVTARIRDDYYNFHDGVTINGVPHAQYNAAVASELEKFAKGKSMNPELAQKFLDENKGSENKIIKAFNDGVRQEVALAAQIGEAEYRKRMSKFTPKTQAYSEARDTAFEAARAAAELEVKKRRGTAAAELSKIANRLSKLDGVIGYAKRGLGYVARHTPILVGGYVYYTTGDVNQALAESTPLCWSLEGGRAIGSFYEYAQDEIEETAFETRYSERWYMGSAHSRQGAYDHAKAARDAAKGR